ncbi:hypothetical protein RYA05_28280 [Pseudomonas syringae pv. actinidiae]|uniref:hypothetical protein n=1 Tax=Pseudomonas syringae TaxID=317 RepID=UPI00031EE8AB|nr:hypothetical protein [Pseudomonas syringae]MBL3607052.1 hypothetical protein [Pseudomonas syringae pv. actinidiae]MBL3625006.1 hypothetical protein [Pseudomonas syringae pv. actinidiae]MBL3636389.1 hypothetical protein [Pseudomonas syringae pv. actinidiae]MBL3664407.1 hypothetical protein [Pseudomonas syringae pv. actinidiae]MCQ4651911.1 hypothetical protein [Pseudomonas syringae]
MSWTDITDNGRVYSMAHLQPFTHVYKVDERDITVHFTFGGNGRNLPPTNL